MRKDIKIFPHKDMLREQNKFFSKGHQHRKDYITTEIHIWSEKLSKEGMDLIKEELKKSRNKSKIELLKHIDTDYDLYSLHVSDKKRNDEDNIRILFALFNEGQVIIYLCFFNEDNKKDDYNTFIKKAIDRVKYLKCERYYAVKNNEGV